MYEHAASLSEANASPRPGAASPFGRRARPSPLRLLPVGQTGFPVYLVERERDLRIALTRDLRAAGFEARPFAQADDLAAALPELPPGCAVSDIAAALAAPSLREGEGRGGLRLPTILHFSALAPDQAIAAVRLGAADLLQRPLAPGHLVAALRRARPKVHEFERRLAARAAKAAIETLTRRERQVLECMMEGHSSKQIARVLGVSPRTVDMHRSRLNRRLSVTSIVDLLSLAWRARTAV